MTVTVPLAGGSRGLLWLIPLLHLVSGCDSRQSEQARPSWPAQDYVLTAGTHRVVLKSLAGPWGYCSDYRGNLDCGVEGGLRLTIKDSRLYVNNLTYGLLDDGQTILVETGVVAIGGTVVTGRPMTAEERLHRDPLELSENEYVLSGHRVVVRSLFESKKITRVNPLIGRNTEKIVGDGTTIWIEDGDRLFVNGSRRLVLAKGQSILLKQGEVWVGGKRVWP